MYVWLVCARFIHLSAVVRGKFLFERRALFRCARINDYFFPRTLDKCIFSLVDDCVKTKVCISNAETFFVNDKNFKLIGEVPKWSQRRRLEIGWSGNSGTWVRIPPSPPLHSMTYLIAICPWWQILFIRRGIIAGNFCHSFLQHFLGNAPPLEGLS